MASVLHMSADLADAAIAEWGVENKYHRKRILRRLLGTEFTCFTGTKVQILTQKALLAGFRPERDAEKEKEETFEILLRAAECTEEERGGGEQDGSGVQDVDEARVQMRNAQVTSQVLNDPQRIQAQIALKRAEMEQLMKLLQQTSVEE